MIEFISSVVPFIIGTVIIVFVVKQARKKSKAKEHEKALAASYNEEEQIRSAEKIAKTEKFTLDALIGIASGVIMSIINPGIIAGVFSNFFLILPLVMLETIAIIIIYKKSKVSNNILRMHCACRAIVFTGFIIQMVLSL